MYMPKVDLAESKNYKWWAFAAIAIGSFVSVSDVGSAGVALPRIADYFHTDLPTIQWVIVGYALTICVLLLPMGRLSDIVGRKRIYLIGFLIFPAGAFLAGIANHIVLLVMARVLMGVGAAMTQGTAMAMQVSVFPQKERGKAMGLLLTVVGTGGVAGPAMSGLIVGALGWRWVFITTGIMGIVAVLAAWLILADGKDTHRNQKASFDWLGALLSSLSLAAFLLTITMVPKVGWGNPGIILGFIALSLFLATFIWWERRSASPMLDLALFKRRVFSFGVSASFLAFVSMSCTRFLMPFYLQVGLLYSPERAGLIMVPGALCLAAAGNISGRLSDRFGYRIFNMGGLITASVGIFILSRLTLDSPIGLALLGMVLQSTGLGIFNPPNSSSVLSTVESSKYGVVSGFLNLVRNSANVAGTALVTVIVTAIMASRGFPPSLAAVSENGGHEILSAFSSGMRVAYVIMGFLALVGVVFSFAKGNRGSNQPQEQSVKLNPVSRPTK